MHAKKRISINVTVPLWWPSTPGRRLLRTILPHAATVLVSVTAVVALFLAQSAGAIPLLAPATGPATSTGTIAYQGRLADPDGTPLTGTYSMIFRLYAAATGGTPLWEETWTGPNGVAVSDGLFNVMLGSLGAIPTAVVSGHDNLWLGITVGTDDEMAPRVQLGSVPWAVQALTVPDGSVTTAKIADGAVTAPKRSVATYSAVDSTVVIVQDMTTRELLRLEATDVPAGDVLLVADLHASSVPGSTTSGSLRLIANGVTVDHEPTHWLPTDQTQMSLHGVLSGFSGGALTVIISVTATGASPDLQFGHSGDGRFARRLSVVTGL